MSDILEPLSVEHFLVALLPHFTDLRDVDGGGGIVWLDARVLTDPDLRENNKTNHPITPFRRSAYLITTILFYFRPYQSGFYHL